MTKEPIVDYYEMLQISTNAEPETINRVYRMLAQRYHPDNLQTGDEARFRALTDAYRVLSNPEKRARYDITHQRQREERWRLISAGAQSENDFEMEQSFRLIVLEILYTRRRIEHDAPGIFENELERLTGRPREHIDFTVWFLKEKKYLLRDDSSRLQITAEGAEYLEQNYSTMQQQKQLRASNER